MLVYVIDDDKFHLENIDDAFTKFSKNKNISIKTFNIKNYYDVEKVESEIITNKPSIIITDQGMPYKDGSTLINKIRKFYRPITILNSAIPKLHEKEFDYIIPKPTNLFKLVNTVEIIAESFELGKMQTIEEVINKYEMKYEEKKRLKKVIEVAIELEKKNEKATFAKIGQVIYFHPRTIANLFRKIINNNGLDSKPKDLFKQMLQSEVERFKK